MNIVLLLLPALTALAIFLIWRSWFQKRRTTEDVAFSHNEKSTVDPYQDIEPLHDFDWSRTQPIKIRPFKPKYHMTMGKFSLRSAER